MREEQSKVYLFQTKEELNVNDGQGRCHMLADDVFLWIGYYTVQDNGSAMLYDVFAYHGASSDDTISIRAIKEGYNEKYRDDIISCLTMNDVGLLSKLTWADHILAFLVQLVTLGTVTLNRSVFDPNLYLPPGFHDWGYYMHFDQIVVHEDQWNHLYEAMRAREMQYGQPARVLDVFPTLAVPKDRIEVSEEEV